MRDEVPSVAKLPTKWGQFDIHVYHEESTGLDHVALMLGSMVGPDPVLVRVHSECLTGDAFSSLRCDCGPQLDAALKAIVEKNLYLLLRNIVDWNLIAVVLPRMMPWYFYLELHLTLLGK